MRHGRLVGWSALLVALALGACDQGGSVRAPLKPVPAKPAAPAQANPALTAVTAINQAQLVATIAPPAPDAGQAPETPQPVIVKAEVLLARAHASPGVIDGLAGSNLARAVKAYEAMAGLPADGELSPAVWGKLTSQGPAPAASVYTITPQDVAGPFYPDYGENMVAASKLPATGYADPAEELAARFHMSEALLQALNPGEDFTHAGAVIAVVRPEVEALASVAHVEVDKAAASVRAYDSQGALIASFPATVGSTEKPSPKGEHKVVDIQFNPLYTYDPAKLTWGPRRHGRFTIKPGPNNPVGVVWIGLNAPGYGIHGSPNPDRIGKTASHGCVRLTNWDAATLAAALKPGTEVDFVRERGQASAAES